MICGFHVLAQAENTRKAEQNMNAGERLSSQEKEQRGEQRIKKTRDGQWGQLAMVEKRKREEARGI